MTTEACLSKEARNRIDAHLDLMDEKLRAGGLSRSERQGILDDLQTQIMEMVMARARGEATSEDVGSVIAGMDPPELFVAEAIADESRETSAMAGQSLSPERQKPANAPNPNWFERLWPEWGRLPLYQKIILGMIGIVFFLALLRALDPGLRMRWSPSLNFGTVIMLVLAFAFFDLVIRGRFRWEDVADWIRNCRGLEKPRPNPSAPAKAKEREPLAPFNLLFRVLLLLFLFALLLNPWQGGFLSNQILNPGFLLALIIAVGLGRAFWLAPVKTLGIVFCVAALWLGAIFLLGPLATGRSLGLVVHDMAGGLRRSFFMSPEFLIFLLLACAAAGILLRAIFGPCRR